MLSYQHMYHAGGLADVHKHILLARALVHLTRDAGPMLYAETHSGRGRYYLDSPSALKTGEAAKGIVRLLAERKIAGGEPFLRALKAIQAPNPRIYPGSPLLAATMLRKQDQLWFWELHPREHGWLSRLFQQDARVRVSHADGQVGLPLKLPPRAPDPAQGMVLIDPSYEVKAEYDSLPGFVERLRRRWPQGAGLLWYPMLPAGRHEFLREAILTNHPDAQVNELTWASPGDGRGLYGSGVIYWGLETEKMAIPAFKAA